MIALDPFSWRAREEVDCDARDAVMCVLNDHKPKESDGITRTIVIHGHVAVRWVAAVYATSNFHATSKARGSS